MHNFLLVFHSLWRWLVLFSLIIAICKSFVGWRNKSEFTKIDNLIRHNTATIAHVQLLLGIWLYFVSPIVAYFLANFKTAIHLREIRFFGMEHISVMITAIVMLTIGSIKAKRKVDGQSKFKTIFIWFGIAFLLILSSIPWAFSPLISRPYFRWF
jgi:hypothetical protein